MYGPIVEGGCCQQGSSFSCWENCICLLLLAGDARLLEALDIPAVLLRTVLLRRTAMLLFMLPLSLLLSSCNADVCTTITATSAVAST